MKTAGLLAFALLSVLQGAAQQNSQQLQKQLAKELRSKQLTLRSPYVSKNILFSSDGTCEGKCERGGWAGNGTLVAREIEVTDNDFIISGDRLVVYYDVKGNPRAIVSGRQIRIDIKLRATLTEQAITDAMQRTFMGAGDPAPNGPPPSVDQDTGTFEIRHQGGELLVREKSSQEWKPSSEVTSAVEIGSLPDGEKVYINSMALVAARPVSFPDPVFPEKERLQRHAGTVLLRIVINNKGRVQGIKVEKGDYPGLIQPAVMAIADWQFTPATLNGQPVACETPVETSFRLY